MVSVGDRIAVSHDVPAWGQSAEVIGWDVLTGILTLTETLTWSASNAMLLRDPQGTPHGPYTPIAVTGQATNGRLVPTPPGCLLPAGTTALYRQLFPLSK